MDSSNLPVDLYTYFYGLVKQIPWGMVSTYGSLARALGDIRAARACGVMLSQNPDPPNIPCHRVVMSDGSIGGFTHPQGIERKIELLEKEGIKVKNGKIVNFENVFFDDFTTDFPLRRLKKLQESLKEEVIVDDRFSTNLVGGVDVSYEGRMAFGALVIMDSSFHIKDVVLKKVTVNFPYIPTYLAFREGKIIGELLKDVDKDIVLLVDGNGILHPREFGLASHVGVEYDVPTIGVAKSLLIGELQEDKIIYRGKQLGWFVKSGKRKGIYTSPGHRVSMETSLRIVRNFLKFKNPEPLRLAHMYANQIRQKTNTDLAKS